VYLGVKDLYRVTIRARVTDRSNGVATRFSGRSGGWMYEDHGGWMYERIHRRRWVDVRTNPQAAG